MIVDELVPLTETLDQILPEKYRFHYRQRVEAIQREIERLLDEL